MLILKSETKKMLMQAITSELYASNFYKNAANYMQREGFFGAQKYFLKESSDELLHYQKIVDYINDLGDVVYVPAIESCESKSPKTLKEALEYSFKLEKELMDKYISFYEKSDTLTCQFLLQFLEIQRTSVGEYGDLLARYSKCGEDKAAILEFDNYLSEL